MNVLQLFGAGLVIAVVAVTINAIKPDFTPVVILCGGAVILLAVIPEIEKLIELIQSASEKADINSAYVSIVIRASGIACATSICSSVCRDMGQTAVGTKLELVGRIAIIMTALPAINALLQLIEKTL